jgi:aldehyde:ferredoxin oxidoreductase
LLAEGTYRAALRIGKMKNREALQYAIQSKGIGLGAHGIRSGRGFVTDIGYACSVQCGDHTSLAGLPFYGVDSEIWEIFNDSAVICNFNTFGLAKDFKFEFYNAVTGLSLNRKKWATGGGLKTLQIQRALLLLGGPDLTWNPKFDDDNPSRFYEPLPSGPYKGKTTNRDRVRKNVRDYYKQAGWDETGIPKSETLLELGLGEVDNAIDKIRWKLEKT